MSMLTYCLSSFGSYGEIVPFLGLAYGLIQNGAKVHVLTNGVYCKEFLAIGVEAHAIDTDCEFSNYLSRVEDLNHPHTLAKLYREVHFKYAERELGIMSSLNVQSDWVVIANSAPGIAARIARERFGCRLILAALYPNQFLAGRILRDLITWELSSGILELRNKKNTGDAAQIEDWWNGFEAYVAFWPKWFSDARPQTCVATHHVGFILPPPRHFDSHLLITERSAECSTPSIIVTGGSATYAGSDFYQAAASGCLLAQSRFKIIGRHLSVSALNLGSLGTVTSSSPELVAEFAHCDLAIHHGGMGTIGQCIATGTPQLILADGADRPSNGRIVEDLGIGMVLGKSDWRPENIGAAILRLLGDKGIRTRCAEYSRHINSNASLTETLRIVTTIEPRQSNNACSKNSSWNFEDLQLLEELRMLTTEQRTALLESLKAFVAWPT